MNSQNPNSKLRFLSLPPEIRNQIYELVFGNQEWHVDPENNFKAKNGHRNALSLLRTCKQINSEGGSYPFILNTFIIGPGLDFRTVAPVGTRFVTSVVLLTHSHSVSTTWSLEKHFPNIQNVRIISGGEDERDHDIGLVELEGMITADITLMCFPDAVLNMSFVTDKRKLTFEDAEVRKRLAHNNDPLSADFWELWNEWMSEGDASSLFFL